MKHEYYQYNAEEILSKGPKFPLIIMKDNAEVFKSMADEMADTIIEHNAKGEKTVFICPSQASGAGFAALANKVEIMKAANPGVIFHDIIPW